MCVGGGGGGEGEVWRGWGANMLTSAKRPAKSFMGTFFNLSVIF